MQKKCGEHLSLSLVRVGQVCKIEKVANAIDFRYQRRLAELGFLTGAEIVVLKKAIKNKTFLVGVGGCAFTIRRDIANAILVRAQ